MTKQDKPITITTATNSKEGAVERTGREVPSTASTFTFKDTMKTKEQGRVFMAILKSYS